MNEGSSNALDDAYPQDLIEDLVMEAVLEMISVNAKMTDLLRVVRLPGVRAAMRRLSVNQHLVSVRDGWTVTPSGLSGYASRPSRAREATVPEVGLLVSLVGPDLEIYVNDLVNCPDDTSGCLRDMATEAAAISLDITELTLRMLRCEDPETALYIRELAMQQSVLQMLHCAAVHEAPRVSIVRLRATLCEWIKFDDAVLPPEAEAVFNDLCDTTTLYHH